MEIQTRRHILEIWRATVDYCYRDGKWRWGGRSGRNSISDAEQLLTILYPATTIESLNIDSVDETADDVLDYLRALGNALDIPRQLIRFIGEYMRTYLVDGTPDFSGGHLLRPDETAERGGRQPEDEQRKLHVVDSYSMSVTLCLATLGFLRVYRQGLRSQQMRSQEVDDWRQLCSQRLTAAMVGLLRSFTVNTFDPTDPPGQTLCAMINQRGVATEILVARPARGARRDPRQPAAGADDRPRPGGRRAGEPGTAVRMRLVLGRRRRGTRDCSPRAISASSRRA